VRGTLGIDDGHRYVAPHVKQLTRSGRGDGVTVFAPDALPLKVNSMADNVVPHFHNDAGVAVIEIGSQEFMCVGANPPFDHPHVFLDLGNDKEIICPYCSTLYRFAADLGAGEARPPECVLRDVA
jgi:uncharacterized Zn-finger protein